MEECSADLPPRLWADEMTVLQVAAVSSAAMGFLASREARINGQQLAKVTLPIVHLSAYALSGEDDSYEICDVHHVLKSAIQDALKEFPKVPLGKWKWMYGDCWSIAAHNPLRWSKELTYLQFVQELRAVESSHRPVKVETHDATIDFKNIREALDALTVNCH